VLLGFFLFTTYVCSIHVSNGGQAKTLEPSSTQPRRGLTAVDEQCAVCQFYVQRIRNTLVQYSGMSGMSGGGDDVVLAEAAATSSKTTSSKATSSKAKTSPASTDDKADWVEPAYSGESSQTQHLRLSQDGHYYSPSERKAPISTGSHGHYRHVPVEEDMIKASATQKSRHGHHHQKPQSDVVEADGVVGEVNDLTSGGMVEADEKSSKLRPVEEDIITVPMKPASLLEEAKRISEAAASLLEQLQATSSINLNGKISEKLATSLLEELTGQPGQQIGVVSGGREKLVHLMNALPPQLRPTIQWQSATPQAQAARAQMEYVVQAAASNMLSYCATRTPIQFLPYCKAILTAFDRISSGLQYGDAPEQICIRYDFCPPASYLAVTPHAVSVISKSALGPAL
jgi:hypothetical protein